MGTKLTKEGIISQIERLLLEETWHLSMADRKEIIYRVEGDCDELRAQIFKEQQLGDPKQD